MSILLEWIRQLPTRPINESLPPSLLLYLIPPVPSAQTLTILLSLLTIILLRIYWILPSDHETRLLSPKMTSSKIAENQVKVAVFLGSGGHTTELLQLLSALPPERYSPRLYLYSSGDRFSLEKAREAEENIFPGSHAQLFEIPRARAVHQSLLSTPLSLAYSLLFCLNHVVLRPRGDQLADLVLMNGPGTCVPIVAAVYALKLFGMRSPKLIYVESFARVNSLSLTAKLVRPLVDRFVVQWPQAAGTLGGRTMYKQWLI